MTLAFLEGLSPIHLLIVAFICLLIFGRRLPEVGRSLGKGITEFKKGLKDAGDEVSGQPQDPYQQNQNYNQQQALPPQRPPQQFQQGYPQQGYQNPPQQQYQGGYQQQHQQMPQPRMPQQPAVAGQSQVRVTRNDMVD